jgi:hypothetical protein
MGEVWRRPSLTALEVAWRWCAGGVVLALAAWQMLLRWRGVHVDTPALQAMTVFQPVAAFHTMDVASQSVIRVAGPVMLWLVPLAVVVWLVLGVLGRTAVMRRFDGGLRARPVTLLVLGALRMGLLGAVWCLWVWAVSGAGSVAITGPAARGGEPNVVLYCAMVICGSLVLYVLWAALSWPLQLAPLLAMERNLGAAAALGETFRSRAVRAKLIEINLVMNIVKIALLVLAMVFSASPLPFTEVATQTFLAWWWTGVVLLYLAAMDYFHVVGSVAYLRMWRTIAGDA